MKTRIFALFVPALIVAMTLAVAPALGGGTPLGTAFTYQGQLKENGLPANSEFAMDFALFDIESGGAQIGVAISQDVTVTNGLFTALLNDSGQFGVGAFDGQQRFLEIRVNGTTLSPRQPVTATPYAQTAAEALSVAGIDGHSLDAADGEPGDAVFVDNNGNVGIGTTTPLDRLHVAGGGLLLPSGFGITKLDTGGVARAVMTYDGSDNAQFFAPPDKLLSLRTGTGGFTSVRATITPAGRFGINTTAPDTLLHVQNGDVGPTGTITASNLLLERTADNWLSFMNPVNRLGGLAFSRPGSTSTELFHGAILYNENTLPDAMQFRTGGNFTRLTIKGSGEVGIGTTSPAAALHVVDGSASGAAFQADDVLAVEGGTLPAIAIGMPAAGSGLFRFSKPSRSDAAKIQYNAATGQFFILADGAVFLGTDSGSGFTSRMTVANDGDVGIGTNAPAGKLHVVASPSGNSSVILPSSSISAAEIFDEPGCAGLVYSGEDVPIGATFPDPPESVLSHLITTPAAGYVLAIATIGSRQVSTSAATVKWGLTTNPASIPADALMIVEFNPAGGAGLWSMPVTLHRLFPVSAGATTVHVMAQDVFGSTEFGKAQLSLIFIPTTYGTAPTATVDESQTKSTETGFGAVALEASVEAADIAALLEELRTERAALRMDLESLRQVRADLEAMLSHSSR